MRRVISREHGETRVDSPQGCQKLRTESTHGHYGNAGLAPHQPPLSEGRNSVTIPFLQCGSPSSATMEQTIA